MSGRTKLSVASELVECVVYGSELGDGLGAVLE